MTISHSELTLLGINLEFLKLIEYREDASVNPDLSEQDRTEVLAKCDEEFRLLVLREVKKADGVSYNLTEFRRRVGRCSEKGWNEDGPIDLEIRRLKALKAQWLARHNSLEDATIRALQFIEQAEGRNRVEGECSTLALKKCPPSVEVAQPELLPSEFKRVSVTFRHSVWCRILKLIEAERDADLFVEATFSRSEEPMKAEIGKVLKSKEPCAECAGLGSYPGMTEDEHCDACGGTGKVPVAVPGCRLIADRVRLEVS